MPTLISTNAKISSSKRVVPSQWPSHLMMEPSQLHGLFANIPKLVVSVWGCSTLLKALLDLPGHVWSSRFNWSSRYTLAQRIRSSKSTMAVSRIFFRKCLIRNTRKNMTKLAFDTNICSSMPWWHTWSNLKVDSAGLARTMMEMSNQILWLKVLARLV